MQNVVELRTRQRGLEKKNINDKTAHVQLLYCPEIVARDGRYVAFADKVICDCFSGFEWLAGPDKDMSWEAGCHWVKGLSTGGGGWRLPTLNELRGLFKMNKNGDNLSPLFGVSMTDVWSCETQDESSAWGFNFLPGNQFWTYKTLSRRFRVLAVRPRRYHTLRKRTQKISD
ncbi:MAG: DUF1566 domain-containing protein [Proteobacteria bacterium]|nr:DUF1566 domain-containing protein [Pseudomonadota bacterium]